MLLIFNKSLLNEASLKVITVATIPKNPQYTTAGVANLYVTESYFLGSN